ncbi:YrhB domain-containing protein [Dickeya zeae]|jgi:hypothetical protein|uniref:YrhB domain-containing protein n=1 Tax=Dickeya zeae TaxID=204042 RepID=UPI0005772251|nr:YrhB domain-containing protein [Dickeya zeae]UJR63917.1 hypothetical protein HJ586_17880 [Dickeya zeae]
MITFDDAIKKANEYLYDGSIPVVITSLGRFSGGWFFCFQSREYLETGDNSALLVGNAPFIVDKDTGEIHELGTAYPLEKYLHDYEERKNSLS